MENDLIRKKILKSLFDIQNKARSRNSQLVGIRDLSREVKKHLKDTKENEVASNVTFLVQNNFVEEVAVENFYAKSKFGNTKPSYKYRLSKEGLAYFEHGSQFDSSNVFAGIGDIRGSGNYIVIGNQNSVTSITSSSFLDGHRLAEDLRRKVNALGALSDDEKVSIQGELETIKAQLSKREPDKGIVQKARENLGALADITTVAPLALKLFEWIDKCII